VGSRADLLCELLARLPEWCSASDLAQEGYTKRNVARILAELQASRLVDESAEANRLSFRLRRPDLLSSLVGGGIRRSGSLWIHEPHLPRWRLLFEVFAHLQDLGERHNDKSDSAKRVSANKLRTRIAPSASALGYSDLPETRGLPSAFDDIVRWADTRLAELASGSADVLRSNQGWGLGDLPADGPFASGAGPGDAKRDPHLD
jgi:hypothetical protein